MSTNNIKVALVYDQVNKFGGAERLLLALHKIYPQAPIYTLVHSPKSASWASSFKVIPSPINIFKPLRTRHQWLSPIAPMMFETFNLNKFDVVISITRDNAKAIITKPETLHICYCLTPTRYLWGKIKEYNQDIKMKLIPNFVKKYFQSVDLLISKRPDRYIAISKEVKNRIKTYYNQDSDVVYPPIEDKFYSKSRPNSLNKRKYYLVVSRLEPYKKTNLVINTFNYLQGETLKVVGTGSQLKNLKKLAKKNIKFLGQVSDQDLVGLYTNAKAVIFPQIEDFGLVPLEAQASGTPVIAFNNGGAMETVINNHTGLFFKHQTVSSLTRAIKKFESGKHQITSAKCQQNALKFTQDRFIIKFRDKVNKLWQKHKIQLQQKQ
ncbi:glycosyltransferase [Patescibacteria group bacterium]|nr:glycosyltransferase [Patescibacteria group bacterium]